MNCVVEDVEVERIGERIGERIEEDTLGLGTEEEDILAVDNPAVDNPAVDIRVEDIPPFRRIPRVDNLEAVELRSAAVADCSNSLLVVEEIIINNNSFVLKWFRREIIR